MEQDVTKRISVLNIQSTTYPDKQLTEDQWFEQTKASSLYNNRKPVHNANDMMKHYDEDKMVKYYKNLLLTI